jgi:hypothetical protein
MQAAAEHCGRDQFTDPPAHFRIVQEPVEIVLQGLVVDTFSIEILPDQVDLFMSLQLRHWSPLSSLIGVNLPRKDVFPTKRADATE